MMLKRVQMNLQCFTCDFYCAITNAFVLNVFCVCAVSNKLFGAIALWTFYVVFYLHIISVKCNHEKIL